MYKGGTGIDIWVDVLNAASKIWENDCCKVPRMLIAGPCDVDDCCNITKLYWLSRACQWLLWRNMIVSDCCEGTWLLVIVVKEHDC